MSENADTSGGRLFAGAGIWAWYADSDRVFADAVTARLFGIDSERARCGIPLTTMNKAVHPSDATRVERAIAKSQEGKPVRVRYRLRHDSYGEKIVISAWQTFMSQAGAPMLSPGMVFDITDLASTDLDLLKAHIDEMTNIVDRWNIQPVSYLLTALRLEVEQAGKRFRSLPN